MFTSQYRGFKFFCFSMSGKETQILPIFDCYYSLKVPSVLTNVSLFIPFLLGCSRESDDRKPQKLVSRNQWSSIVYRHGQKQLTSLFLKEAEQALQLSLSEEN